LHLFLVVVIILISLFLISKTVFAKLLLVESRKSLIQQRSESFENYNKKKLWSYWVKKILYGEM